MKQNYVKFIEGKGYDLTSNKPYLYQVVKGDLLRITDDVGSVIDIFMPSCSHIKNNKWFFCDSNGNLIK